MHSSRISGLKAVLLVAVGVSVTGTFVIARRAQARDTVAQGICGETTDKTGSIVHRFGLSGVCYQGAPNSVHDDWQDGYCHTYHYDC